MDMLLHTVVVGMKTIEAPAAEYYVQSALTYQLPQLPRLPLLHQAEQYAEALDTPNFHYILSASTFLR
jgi:hypothetical protein